MKTVRLSLEGSFEQGFSGQVSIYQHEKELACRSASLPPNNDLYTRFKKWHELYVMLGDLNPFALHGGVTAKSSDQPYFHEDCHKLTEELTRLLNQWLDSQEFRAVPDLIREHSGPTEEIRITLVTNHPTLPRLPWDRWHLLSNSYRNSEVAVSFTDFIRPEIKVTSLEKPNILVILSNEFDTSKQRDYLARIAKEAEAEIHFADQLESSLELTELLRTQSWSIICFFGHSSSTSDLKSGTFTVNGFQRETTINDVKTTEYVKITLSIPELKESLRHAISRGLRLALFCSCDGIGLAHQLGHGESLYLPQTIVMREPIPIAMTSIFLQYFFDAFTTRGSNSLYLSLRKTRDRLADWRTRYPSIDSLPVLYLNPSVEPLTWVELGGKLRQPPVKEGPYPGLASFGLQNRDMFFGREHEIEDIIERLKHTSLITLIGTSGSGKSSLLMAGLIPQYSYQASWTVITVRPGNDPFQSLATALNQTFNLTTDKSKLIQNLQEQEQTLKDIIGQQLQLKDRAKNLLFVIDQFEELFRQDPQVTTPFLNSLIYMNADLAGVKLLISIRVDFIGETLKYPQFNQFMQGSEFYLRPMRRIQLKDAIIKPAAKFMICFDDGLVDRLIDDLGSVADSLPLLQATLTELWDEQDNNCLTNAAYTRLSGVKAAITRIANRVYNALSDPDKRTMEKLMVQLIRPGTDTADTGQIVKRSYLSEEAWNLAYHLSSQEERLVVISRNEEQDEEQVELIHEALITYWDKLNRWTEIHKQFRLWQEELRKAYAVWIKENREKASLLQGRQLLIAEDWLDKHPDDIQDHEKEFIQKSIKLRKQNQAFRRQMFIGTGFLLFSLIAAGLTAIGLQQAVSQSWEGIRLEREGDRSLERFEQQQLEGLLIALYAGRDLRQEMQRQLLLPWILPRQSQSLYSLATSPVFALHTMLEGIHEKNRLSGGWRSAFSPDGNHIITSSSGENLIRVWDLSGHLKATLSGHEGSIERILFSPDSSLIATAALDGTVRIWDLQGNELAIINEQGKYFDYVSFHPNNKLLVTATRDGTAQVWDLQGRELATIRESEGIKQAKFSPNGANIITISGSIAKTWDLEGNEITTFKGHQDQITDVAFDPSNTYVATASADNTARIWDLTGNEHAVLAAHQDRIESVEFSPDGTYVVTGSRDRTARIWNLNGQESARLNGHQGWVTKAKFHPNSNFILTASNDSTARIFDLTGNTLKVLVGHRDAVRDIDISPDGNHILTSTSPFTRIWNFEQRDEVVLKSSDDGFHGFYDVEFNPDGDRIVTGSLNGRAQIWDLQGNEIAEIKGRNNVDFNPDGSLIITVDEEDVARIWDQYGQEVIELSSQVPGRVAEFSPDGKYVLTDIITGTEQTQGFKRLDIQAQIWNLQGQPVTTLVGHQASITDADFSPNGNLVVTASADGIARVWNLEGEEVSTLIGHQADTIAEVQFSPDGKRIVTASHDHTARLWDLNGNELAILANHLDRLWSVDFSPNSQLIVTSSHDLTARVWDLNGNQISVLTGHTDKLWTARFSPDGNYIMTGAHDGTARLWDIDGIELATFTLGGFQSVVMSVAFSPNSTHIIAASENGIAKIYPFETLDQLLLRGCNWIEDFLNNSSYVSESDRQLCQTIRTEIREMPNTPYSQY